MIAANTTNAEIIARWCLLWTYVSITFKPMCNGNTLMLNIGRAKWEFSTERSTTTMNLARELCRLSRIIVSKTWEFLGFKNTQDAIGVQNSVLAQIDKRLMRAEKTFSEKITAVCRTIPTSPTLLVHTIICCRNSMSSPTSAQLGALRTFTNSTVMVWNNRADSLHVVTPRFVQK